MIGFYSQEPTLPPADLLGLVGAFHSQETTRCPICRKQGLVVMLAPGHAVWGGATEQKIHVQHTDSVCYVRWIGRPFRCEP